MQQLSLNTKHLAQKASQSNVRPTGTIFMKMSSKSEYKESAFVMITCEDDQDLQVVEELKFISEIKEIQHTYGNYSIIVKVETDDAKSLADIIEYKIRKINKIRSTTTLISSPMLIF